MKTGFLDTAEDVQWLKETHLKGVTLPTNWAGFQSYILQGNEDAPHAVNLYTTVAPVVTDDYYRVRFVNDSGAYAEACQYDGRSDRPIGGLVALD